MKDEVVTKKYFTDQLDSIVTAIMQEFKAQREYMDTKFETIDYRISSLEQNSATKADVDRILKHIGSLESKI